MGEIGGYAVRDANNNIIGYSATRGGEILPGTENIPSENFLKLQAQYNQQHGNIVTGGGTYQNSSYVPPHSPSYTGGAAGIYMQQLNAGVEPSNINKYVAEKAFEQLGGGLTESRKALLLAADPGKVTVPIREYIPSGLTQPQKPEVIQEGIVSPKTKTFTDLLVPPKDMSDFVTNTSPTSQHKPAPDIGFFNKDFVNPLRTQQKTREDLLNSTYYPTNQSNKNYGQVNLSGVSDNLTKLTSGLSGGLTTINTPNQNLSLPRQERRDISEIFANNTLTQQIQNQSSKPKLDLNSSQLYKKDYGQVDFSGINAMLQTGLTDISKSATEWNELTKKTSYNKENTTERTNKSVPAFFDLGNFGGKHDSHPHARKQKTQQKKTTDRTHKPNLKESDIFKEMGLILLSKPGQKKTVKEKTHKKKDVKKKKSKRYPLFWGI